MNAQSLEEMHRQLLDKAVEDEAFRAELVASPKSVIHQEFGVTVPEGIDIQVHESDMNTVHLALPPNAKLTEDQMQQVAGGFWE